MATKMKLQTFENLRVSSSLVNIDFISICLRLLINLNSFLKVASIT